MAEAMAVDMDTTAATADMDQATVADTEVDMAADTAADTDTEEVESTADTNLPSQDPSTIYRDDTWYSNNTGPTVSVQRGGLQF